MPTLKKLSIPGIALPPQDETDNSQNAYHIHKTKNDFAPLNLDTPAEGSAVLLTPVVTAFLWAEPKEVLQICPIVFVNKAQQIEQFNLYYNYTLDSNGEPQIAIYICYHKEEINATEYEYHTFEIYLHKSAIKDANNQEVELSEIKTTEVFLINTDPRTSRGTVTTVQNQTSRSNS